MAKGGEEIDCAKVRQLMLQLRREKGLTQKKMAEQLNISDKTASKWECDAGCPDVFLWEELSVLLGVDIRKLLQGELSPDQPDMGKLDRIQFCVCPTCESILTSTGAAIVSRYGCRSNPPKADRDIEGHETTVQIVDNECHIAFDHETSREYYILFAIYICDGRVLLNHFYPEREPVFRLPVVWRAGSLYFYYTEHGLRAYRPKYRVRRYK